jgi:hypothetical protein
MPAEFWGEAVSTAVFLLNCAPTKALAGKTPFEAWHGHKLVVHFLRTFGCLAYMKKQGHLCKLDDRSTPVVFIGYEDGGKAYRLLDPVTRRVSIVCDVIFDEDRSWSWTSTMDSNTTDSGSSEFQVKYNYTAPFHAPTPSPTPSPVPAAASPATPAPSSTASSDREDSPFELEHITPLENDEERFDAAHRGDSPVRYRTIEGVIGAGQPVPRLAQRNLEGELNMISTGEPRHLQKQNKRRHGVRQ